jgi:hypothetical protein
MNLKKEQQKSVNLNNKQKTDTPLKRKEKGAVLLEYMRLITKVLKFHHWSPRRREDGADWKKKNNKEIINEDIPNLAKTVNLQIQEAEQNLNKSFQG